MPRSRGKGVASKAARTREEEELESESEDSEEEESSSEESGESEVSEAKPPCWFDSDDSRNMSDEERTTKQQALQNKGARNDAVDDEAEPEYRDIHADDATYRDDERVLVSVGYLRDMTQHKRIIERENKELAKNFCEHKKEMRILRSENWTNVKRGRRSMIKDCKMTQVDHANMSRTKESVKLKIWPHIKRMQKKDLVYSTTEGTVCHIVMTSDAIQWTDSCDKEEDRKWYYETRVAPWINMALQELLSANNDGTRKQYKCE